MTDHQDPDPDPDDHDPGPTPIRPCPAFQRLDALMASGGKTTKDGWTSAAFSDWWSWHGGAA